MAEHSAVSFFFLKCMEPGINKVADVGSFLSASGLLSRDYKDGFLPDALRLDTWDMGNVRIFPAQSFIYDSIFRNGFFPETAYDIIFFFNKTTKVNKDFLIWATTHGKVLLFRDDLCYPEITYTGLSDEEMELYDYQDTRFILVNRLEHIRQIVTRYIEEKRDDKVLDYLSDKRAIVNDDLFLLKALIGISADAENYDEMWKYVRQAYKIDKTDPELQKLYEKMNYMY